jgi:predicted DNA repair protein MutK
MFEEKRKAVMVRRKSLRHRPGQNNLLPLLRDAEAGAVGTAAMIWVGGSIIVHGLDAYDVHFVRHAIGSVAEVAAHTLPSVAAAAKWMVETVLSGVIGLLIGGISIPAIGFAIALARSRPTNPPAD